MVTSATEVVLLIAPLIITAIVWWIAISRTRSEPRRLSNAYWLLVAVLLATQALADLGVPGSGALLILIVMAPLLVLGLTVFLILNGVVMLRRERVSVANLLSLVTGLGLIVVIAAAPMLIRSGNRWLITALGIVLILLGYLGFHFVAFLGYALVYPRLVRDRPADWVVVLGAGLSHGRRVTPLLESRIRVGMAEQHRRGARLLVLSGGRGPDEERSEAEAMAEWAIENGAAAEQVVIENRSRNTEQNLAYSSELVPAESQGLIVTSNYHTLRAATLARKVGLPAQAAGAPTAGYYWPSAMIREYLAVLSEHKIVHAVLMLLVGGPIAALAVAGLVAN
ncbi:YdcF family protein [Microlunatus sp. Gsoil 973]|jgi:uncharacterized SAM-binding protein YcdF (DUF218 family)|uniref:YdcF family protein n=1 Tax=Microlunatus sp. Gsoil 973 TaxID=2672569 RepID=UPI0012B4E9D3|nr:YdcF family protein [Microlunatus sp. Gsoil 973]QGN31536.1 YdcF family protein [Microlunatus sp. Gsoil 973]